MRNAFLGSSADRKTTNTKISRERISRSDIHSSIPWSWFCLQEEGWIQMKVKALTCRSKSIINFSTESCVSGLHLLMRSLWRRIYPSPPRPYWRGEHRFHFWILESSRLESSLVMGRVFRWKWERRRNKMNGPGIRVWMPYLYPKPFFARSSGHF